MNTLFIIGNGFDLAHGLETSYRTFIFHLIKSELLKLGDEIESFGISEHLHSDFLTISLNNQLSPDPTFKKNFLSKFASIDNLPELQETISNYNGLKNFGIKNTIISASYNSKNDPNWSDIEWQYFKLLTKILIPPHGSPLVSQTKNLQNSLVALNKDLDQLSKHLKEYLSKVDENKINDFNFLKKYQDIFKNHEGHKNLILNFNYTSLVSQYPSASNYHEIQIHGSLKNTDPIIVGYGDETTSLYQEMENQNNFEFLRHTKSSRYAENDNYSKVHLFINESAPGSFNDHISINGDEYEIVVLGHSCGLSDRVLLKELMEKENCTKIHVYYYDDKNGNTDFLKTVSNISRHFKNKVEMRSKVQSFDVNYRMPQRNDELDL
jgi:hypothetical protein